MLIFLSYSGSRGKQLARFLKDWLPRVDDELFCNIWLDTTDLRPGSTWHEGLIAALKSSGAGIICTTPEGASSAWLVAEFVCLWKYGDGLALPYLVGGARTMDLPGPMTALNPIFPNKDETWGMINLLAKRSRQQVAEQDLKHRFEAHWPALQQLLEDIGGREQKLIDTAEADVRTYRGLGNALKGFLSDWSKAKGRPTHFRLTVERAAPALVMLLVGVALCAHVMTHGTPNSVVRGLRVQLGAKEGTIAQLKDSNAVLVAGLDNSLSKRFVEANFTSNALAQAYVRSNETLLVTSQRLEADRRQNYIPRTNALDRLPVTEENLSDIPGATRPDNIRPGDFLMFMPREAPQDVVLYRDAPGTEPAERLQFGIPYRANAFAADSNIVNVLPAKTEQNLRGGWLHDWNVASNYIILKLSTNGLAIPGWLFLRDPNPRTPSADAAPSQLDRFHQPLDSAEAAEYGLVFEKSGPRIVVRQQLGRSNTTLQEAIDAATNGQTILIRDGKYLGPIAVKSGVRLQAEHQGKATLVSRHGQPMVRLGDGAGLVGFQLRAIEQKTGLPPSGVEVIAATNVLIAQNEFHSTGEAAIEIRQSAARIFNNILAEHPGNAIQFLEAREGSAAVNNTIYKAGIGISLRPGTENVTNVYVANNAFLGCGKGIAAPPAVLGTIDYNAFGDTPIPEWDSIAGFGRPTSGHNLTSTAKLVADPLKGIFWPDPDGPLVHSGHNEIHLFKDDLSGSPRPTTGPWTIGALEIVAAPSDLHVVSPR